MLNAQSALQWETLVLLRRKAWLIIAASLVLPTVVSVVLWVERWRYEEQGREVTGWGPYAGEGMHPALQFACLIVSLLVTLSVLSGTFSELRQKYVLPASTGDLLWSPFAWGAAGAALSWSLPAAMLNFLFDAQLPVLDPALYFALGYVLFQAISHGFRGDRTSQVLAGLAVIACLFYALMSHYGQIDLFAETSLRERPRWDAMQVSQLVWISALMALAWNRALHGAERDRCGLHASRGRPGILDRPITMGNWSLGGARKQTPGFSSPQLAQFWYEWQLDGWLVPLGTGAALLLGGLLLMGAFVYEALRYRSTPSFTITYFVECSFAGITLLVGLAFLTLAWTNAGRRLLRQKPLERYAFTLPISSRELGYIAFARSWIALLAAWAASLMIGTVLFSINLFLACCWGKAESFLRVTEDLLRDSSGLASYARMFLAAILISWPLLGVTQAAILTGRRWIAALPIVGWVTLIFCSILIGSLLQGSQAVNEFFSYAVPMILCGGILLGVIESYRRSLLAGSSRPVDVLVGLGFWLVSFAASDAWLMDARTRVEHPLSILLLFVACSGMALPVVLPPWAVSVARHRA